MKKIFANCLIVAAVLTFNGCTKEDDETPIVNTPDVSCFLTSSYDKQLPNMDFELWGSSAESNGRYEEPCGGVWASGNAGTVLFNKVTVSKSTEAASGVYSARLETQTALVLAAGSMFAGSFTANLQDPAKSAKIGQPFTERPLALEGYYRYYPGLDENSMPNDEGHIFVLLSKYNTTSKRRDTVGFGELIESNTVATFQKFNFNISYQDTIAPDSVSLVCLSSKDGLNFKGEEGSVLFVDNFSFIY